jgi:hypothetical protein
MVRRGSPVRVRKRASTKALQTGLLCCLSWRVLRARVRDGYTFPGLAGIRGQARRLASPCDTSLPAGNMRDRRKSPCIRAPTVALLGKSLTPSLERGGHRCPVLGLTPAVMPERRGFESRRSRKARKMGSQPAIARKPEDRKDNRRRDPGELRPASAYASDRRSFRPQVPEHRQHATVIVGRLL